MNLLITGGFGHIGSHIINNINKIKSIKKLYIIDYFYKNKPNSLFNLKKSITKIFIINKDLSKRDSLKKFPKTDIVLHLASMTDAEKSIEFSKEIYKNNIGIFENIIKYCESNSSKLIHISTTSVYGKLTGFLDEKLKKLEPQTPYAKIKLLEEKKLQKSKKINYISFRFGTIAGISPGMRFHTAVNKFCWQAVMEQPLTVWTTAYEQLRPYLDLSDAVRAMAFVIKNNIFDGNIYNVVTANSTVKEVVEVIRQEVPELKVNFVEHEIMNQLSYEVLNTRMEKSGFEAQGDIEKGIKDTISLLKKSQSCMHN